MTIEKLTDTESEIYCAIGGTVVQAKVTVNKVLRGIFGSVRSANNPIVINLTGEENLKSGEFSQPYTVTKYLRSQVLKTMGSEFKELKPESDSFRTINFNLRVILDDGNHLGAVLLGGLTAFFLWASTQQTEVEESFSSNMLPKSLPFPIVCWEAPGSSSAGEGKLFIDPSYKEELIGGSFWVYLVTETGQSLFRTGGTVLTTELSLYKGDDRGQKWREWIRKGKDGAETLQL